MNYVKGLLGIGLLAIALYAGFASVPIPFVLLLGVLFTVAYIQGKWYLWRDLFQRWNLKLLRSLITTYLIQTVVVFVFYLIGRGIAQLPR